jgi:hypothetical protein
MEALCGHCGAKIWSYSTPSGGHVALEDVPRPYVIVRTKAVKGGPTDGYRDHRDYCKAFALWRQGGRVSNDEFLWP